jgi:hypothetical protein
MSGEKIITPQAYPLWAALVPASDDGQPLMTSDGEPMTEEIIDFIYPSCYRVVAWEHQPGQASPLPILVGAIATGQQVYQYAEDREDAENLARLRIREALKRYNNQEQRV